MHVHKPSAPVINIIILAAVCRYEILRELLKFDRITRSIGRKPCSAPRVCPVSGWVFVFNSINATVRWTDTEIPRSAVRPVSIWPAVKFQSAGGLKRKNRTEVFVPEIADRATVITGNFAFTSVSIYTLPSAHDLLTGSKEETGHRRRSKPVIYYGYVAEKVEKFQNFSYNLNFQTGVVWRRRNLITYRQFKRETVFGIKWTIHKL